MLDLLGHTALLVTSRNGTIPDFASLGFKFLAVYSIIDIIGDGEMTLPAPVCHELIEQPVYEFL